MSPLTGIFLSDGTNNGIQPNLYQATRDFRSYSSDLQKSTASVAVVLHFHIIPRGEEHRIMDNRIKNLQIAAEFQNLKWSIRRASEYVEDTLKTDHAKMPPPPTTMKLTRGKRKSPERTPESTPTIPKVLRISGRELHDAKRLTLQRAKTRREAEPTQVIDWAPFVNTVVLQEPKPASP
ncbi:hypothetical protein PROFUN_10024 [Planoprotostelium fungivorum]|uniref:Uncharacterized protein n=1 Tax=Planoprotostelium fungivorum TaxID=1890364 RepID=A0A2P6NFR9_9EUKA|nr:hypothetical protein PROFUN_10024 [Planoprotostelium fungivorum]